MPTMTWRSKAITPTHLAIALLVLLAFAVGANKGWLNPRPDLTPTCKISQTNPFLWQYDMDSQVELYSAVGFPFNLHETPQRINRPLYPALVRLLGEAYFLAAYPFYKLSLLERAVLGYLTLKILVFTGFGLLFYHFSRRYVGDKPALLGLALILSDRFSLMAISTYHTYELEFISPLVITALFASLGQRYSLSRNVLFSIFVGLLMLGRQNYSCYLAILLYGLYLRRFLDVAVSLAAHLLPLLVWLAVLAWLGVPYRNTETAEYGQGVWLYQEFIHYSPLAMAKSVAVWVSTYLQAASAPIWALAAVALVWLREDQDLRRKIPLGLLGLMVLTNWLQVFAARRVRHLPDDLWFILFPLVGFALLRMLGKAGKGRENMVIACAFGLGVAWCCIGMLKLPWLPPVLHGMAPAVAK